MQVGNRVIVKDRDNSFFHAQGTVLRVVKTKGGPNGRDLTIVEVDVEYVTDGGNYGQSGWTFEDTQLMVIG